MQRSSDAFDWSGGGGDKKAIGDSTSLFQDEVSSWKRWGAAAVTGLRLGVGAGCCSCSA